jgi:hypothetical protein
LSAIRTTEPAVAGDRPVMMLPEGTTALRGASGERLPIIDGVRPSEPLPESGVYTAIDDADRALGPVVVNVSAAAGDTATQLGSSVEAWLQRNGAWTFAADAEALGAALERVDDRTPLATSLLLVLVGLLLAESLLARRFSRGHEAISEDDAGRGVSMKVIRPTIDEPAGGKGETT